MTESDMQTRFSRWLRKNVEFTIAYELKISHTNRLAFDRLLEHQRLALLQAKRGTLCYKIPDAGPARKPFDGFCINKCPAVVGVMYYSKGETTVYLIDIDDYIEESKGKSKSLPRERAEKIAWREVKI
jgi:hypothetical protein